MFSRYSTLALLVSSHALASPINPLVKRQDPVASTFSAVGSGSVVPISTNTFPGMNGPQTSAPSGPAMSGSVSAPQPSGQASSPVGSMPAGSMLAPGAMPTTQPTNMSEGMPSGPSAYPCPDGYLLTYVEEQRNYPNATLSNLRQVVVGFQNASYFGYVNGTGGDMVGATRTLASGHNEVLVELVNDIPGTTIIRKSVFNLTNGPIMVGTGASISNYSTVLQIYTNTTLSSTGPGPADNTVGTVKLFSNFCASNQTAGANAQREAFGEALQNIAILTNGNNSARDNSTRTRTTGMMPATMALPNGTMTMSMPSMSMPSMSMPSMSMPSMMSLSSMMAPPASSAQPSA